MCGRLVTSQLSWREIHEALASFLEVSTPPINDLSPSDDVRPTTRQLTARVEDGALVVERRRWGSRPSGGTASP